MESFELFVNHFVRRLLPLTALLKMTLIFPDNAPSRFGLALRTGTTKQLEQTADIYSFFFTNLGITPKW